jgi:carbon-monoxide dehydrogenase medium subunit
MHASPAGNIVGAATETLMALGAKMVAEKSSAKREITAEDFFVDAYETSLQSDEVLTEIRIPTPATN